MKKKIKIFCLLTCVICLLCACSANRGPENTVHNFCECMKAYDTDGMKNYMSVGVGSEALDNSSDTEGEFEALLFDYFKSNLQELTYTVKEAEVNGDVATVSVDFTYLDAGTIFGATVSDYFSQALTYAFSGAEVTDEQMENIFVAAFEKQRAALQPVTAEATVEFVCEKTENGWVITDVDEAVFNIMTSNFLGTMNEFSDSLGGGEESDSAEAEQIRVDKKIGDKVELATINLTITGFEECQELVPEYGEADVAQAGAKFVVIYADIENTTKEGLTFDGSAISLVDDQDRTYQMYTDAIMVMDDLFLYTDLAPNIVETGTFVYKVPSDSVAYSMVVGKAGTDEVYYISIA